MEARNALSFLDCDARTHGLATTGNDMIRHTTLFSGDSAAWKQHATFGMVDLVETETILAECPTSRWTRDQNGKNVEIESHTRIEERPRTRYRQYHISAEENDLKRDTGQELLDNPRHFARLSHEERVSVRERVERYVPMPLAQLNMRARSLVNLAELQAFAASFKWREPTGPTATVEVDSVSVDPGSYYGKKVEVRPYPLAQDRNRFLTDWSFAAL